MCVEGVCEVPRDGRISPTNARPRASHPPPYRAHGRVLGECRSRHNSNTTTLSTKVTNTIMSGMHCASPRNTPLQSTSYAMPWYVGLSMPHDYTV